MKFNTSGINRLVELVGIRPEIDNLMIAGLTYSQLAEVLDSLFNPRSSNSLEWFCKSVLKDGSPNTTPTAVRYKYDWFRLYYGIGTLKDFSFKSLAEYEGVSSLSVRRPSQRFEDIVSRAEIPKKSRDRYKKKYVYAQDVRIAEAVRNRSQRIGELKREIYYRSLEKICSS